AHGIGYANRNVAIKQSRGHFIAYLAHDDIWLPDHLEILTNKMVAEKKDFVYSQSANVSPYGIISTSHFHLGNPKCLKNFLAFKAGPRLSTIMHLKDSLDQYGYWSESIEIGGDIELWVRLYKSGKLNKFALDPAPTSALIFRAVWHGRSKRFWRRPVEDIASRLHLSDGVLPPQLQFEIIPPQTEQEALWTNISIDSVGWTNEFRKTIIQWTETRLFNIDHLSYFVFQKIVFLLKSPFRIYRGRIIKKEENRLLH
ncbi:MAG: glycosyltransferase, partial [Candidatus Neomarinimicrobiota bacterium]